MEFWISGFGTLTSSVATIFALADAWPTKVLAIANRTLRETGIRRRETWVKIWMLRRTNPEQLRGGDRHTR